MASPYAVQQPPPDINSVRSWLVVFGASLAFYCTVGFVNAFGVFQEYYKTFLQGKSDTDISWIGSVSIFLLYICSPVVGVLVDKLGPTLLLCLGSFGLLLAVFITSICTEYYQLILAQGVLLGLSMSLIFCPSLAVVSRRLPHCRGLAIGLVVGGSSIGGIVWPIMLDQLLFHDSLSFGWVLRIVAFTMIPLLAIACLTVTDAPVSRSPTTLPDLESESSDNSDITARRAYQETAAEKQHRKTDFSILRNKTFLMLCLGLMVVYLGLFTPFFYVSSYAIQQGLSSSTALYLISAINASSFFGRVIPGYLADKYGHFNLCVLSVFLAGAVGFCWTAAFNLPGMVIWSLAYGFASGAVMSLQGACSGKIAAHENQGTAVGLVTGSVAISALVGTPISGQILLRGGYLGLGMWTGATLIVGAGILAIARLKLDRNIFAAH